MTTEKVIALQEPRHRVNDQLLVNRDGPDARVGRRRPRIPFQRQPIVEAAIRAVEDGNLATLSLRSLADDLEVSAMALRGHVDDKNHLLDEVLNHSLAREAAATPFPGDWPSWLLVFAEQLHLVLTAQPALLAR